MRKRDQPTNRRTDGRTDGKWWNSPLTEPENVGGKPGRVASSHADLRAFLKFPALMNFSLFSFKWADDVGFVKRVGHGLVEVKSRSGPVDRCSGHQQTHGSAVSLRGLLTFLEPEQL